MPGGGATRSRQWAFVVCATPVALAETIAAFQRARSRRAPSRRRPHAFLYMIMSLLTFLGAARQLSLKIFDIFGRPTLQFHSQMKADRSQAL